MVVDGTPGQSGQEGQCCAEGHELIRVTVLDAAGQQVPGVWVHEKHTGWYQVTGHKGDDPYWGPGDVELINLDGGQVCIASGHGGTCESKFTRNLPCHDPLPFEDLWAAGYCDCLERGITKELCQQRYDSGQWRPIFPMPGASSSSAPGSSLRSSRQRVWRSRRL